MYTFTYSIKSQSIILIDHQYILFNQNKCIIRQTFSSKSIINLINTLQTFKSHININISKFRLTCLLCKETWIYVLTFFFTLILDIPLYMLRRNKNCIPNNHFKKFGSKFLTKFIYKLKCNSDIIGLKDFTNDRGFWLL